MNQQRPLLLLTICAVIVGLSILGLIGGFSTRLIGSLDGLLMLAVCLMTALIFARLLFVLAKEQGWLGKHGKGDGTAPEAGAGK